MAESSSTPQEKSQYHHFVPRFILRNYSHPGPPPLATKKRGKRKNGPRPPEQMVFGIDLSDSEPKITETPVAKTFGMIDMYRDPTASSKQHQIEEQLSILESRAGEVISTIRKAFEAGKEEVWITRTQRDVLRKFLFIMKYRGKRFHQRYFHQTAEEYDENDKERMLKYMKEKGFKRPIDVWFDNIKGILDLKMDPGLAWMEKIQKRIYPDDAKWFCNNVQQFYLAFVTPEDKENEFLLTQNAYGIHEGHETQRYDPKTGKMECKAYTEFHVFAPISPKLLIVLRTFMLPVPEEDKDDEIRDWREAMYRANVMQHDQPAELIGRILRDLPIGKAKNSYSEVVNGKVVPINDNPRGANDRFGFRFFSISEEFVGKINGIMLEQSYMIDLIVFNDKAATYKTVEKYMKRQSAIGLDTDQIRGVLKLGKAANLLAASLPVQDNAVPSSSSKSKSKMKEILPEDKLYPLFTKDEKMRDIYTKLSGKPLDKKDFDQARGLLFMRIKLDSRTVGLPPEAREKARNDFLHLYNTFPNQVIWIYLKRIRFMKHGYTMIAAVSNQLEDSPMPVKHLAGLEDVIATSRQMFRENAFCRVMHYASFNGALLDKPMWGLVKELTLDDHGMRRLHEEKQFVLGPQGSICDCGIPNVEEAARSARAGVTLNKDKLMQNWKDPLHVIFTEDEKIELFTRNLLSDFQKDEKERGRPGLVEDPEVERILFKVIYPLFGARQSRIAEVTLATVVTTEDEDRVFGAQDSAMKKAQSIEVGKIVEVIETDHNEAPQSQDTARHEEKEAETGNLGEVTEDQQDAVEAQNGAGKGRICVVQ